MLAYMHGMVLSTDFYYTLNIKLYVFIEYLPYIFFFSSFERFFFSAVLLLAVYEVVQA